MSWRYTCLPLVLLLMAFERSPRGVATLRLEAAEGGKARAGQAARLELSLRDPAANYPLTGQRPSVWLVPTRDASRASCQDWLSRLLSTPAPPRGVIDLNGFDIVQATADGQIALVEPQLSLASANIKALLELGEVPKAWALTASGQRLAAALSGDRSLRLLSLEPLAHVARIALPAAPTAVMAVGEQFWVGTRDGQLVRVFADGRAAAPVRLGQGAVQLIAVDADTLAALAQDGSGAFIAASADLERFTTTAAVGGAQFSKLADSVYALTQAGSILVQVPRDATGHGQRWSLSQPISALEVDPTGRWLALQHADRTAITIFDTTSNHERWTIQTNDPVTTVGFSDAFLYLMHERQAGVTRVLLHAEAEQPAVSTLAAGAPSAVLRRATPLPLLARIPRVGALLASTRDRMAYMVGDDGAQAAMTAVPLRAGETVGLMLHDRSVQERRNGAYSARFVPSYGGEYLAVVRLEQPSLAHCQRVQIAGPADPLAEPSGRAQPAQARALRVVQPVEVGARELHFELAEPARLQRALLLESDGRFQEADRVERGRADVVVHFEITRPGPMRLFVEYSDESGHLHTVATTLAASAASGALR